MAAGVGVEQVNEVGVQGAVLQAAGGVGGEQAGDALLAGLGLAAEAPLDPGPQEARTVGAMRRAPYFNPSPHPRKQQERQKWVFV
jgi:hypothetical protein